jgi:dienelactone hydrolase
MTDASAEPAASPTLLYHARKHFDAVFRKRGRQMGLKVASPAAVKAWQRKARAKLHDLLGLKLMKPAPARPRMTESVDCGDYTREHWLIDTQRDITMPFYLLRSKGAAGRLPAVLCPHGHCAGGKIATAGVAETDQMRQLIQEFNYDYGVQFARAGFLAFCPDARGFGERRDPDGINNPLGSTCHQLDMMGAPLGIPVAGMWIFDLMRLIDHIQTRKDARRGPVGCAGLSGGGLQTLYLSAVDTRVACAVVSGYFYGARESLLHQPGNCPCNIIPHMWESFDLGDLGALIAPRPLLIETGDVDGLNGASGLKNVRSQVAIARKAYRAHKAQHKLCHDVFEGPHRWNGVKAIPWMKRWLGQ